MIVTVGKSVNTVTRPTMTAPMVAPTSGIRSNIRTSTDSGAANGTPRIDSTMNVVTPAIVAWNNLSDVVADRGLHPLDISPQSFGAMGRLGS